MNVASRSQSLALRLGAAALIAWLSVACAAGTGTATGTSARPGATSSASAAATNQTVRGNLVARPCTGGPERAGASPCPGLPVADATVVFVAGSRRVEARTSADGSFSADLAPGRYSVSVEGRAIFGNPAPLTVDVQAPAPGQTPAPLRLVVDSGMR